MTVLTVSRLLRKETRSKWKYLLCFESWEVAKGCTLRESLYGKSSQVFVVADYRADDGLRDGPTVQPDRYLNLY